MDTADSAFGNFASNQRDEKQDNKRGYEELYSLPHAPPSSDMSLFHFVAIVQGQDAFSSPPVLDFSRRHESGGEQEESAKNPRALRLSGTSAPPLSILDTQSDPSTSSLARWKIQSSLTEGGEPEYVSFQRERRHVLRAAYNRKIAEKLKLVD
eukprot:1880416-Rhodomonas_salina.2